MKYDEFIGAVQDRAKLGSRQDAVRATRATLETFAERLLDQQADKLAAQLPHEIGEYLRHVRGNERFDSDQFLHRVSEKENVALSDAAYHARVVTEVLKEAVSEGEIEKVRRSLPRDFQRLFESGSRGKMPPA